MRWALCALLAALVLVVSEAGASDVVVGWMAGGLVASLVIAVWPNERQKAIVERRRRLDQHARFEEGD